MNTEDAHLIEACRNHDRAALHTLYERYAPQMYGLLLRYAPTPSMAEDLLHDGFIKVFQNIKRLRNTESLFSWIRSVMLYTAISAFRSKRQTSTMDKMEEECVEVQQDVEEMLSGVDLDFIQKAISQLPDRYRLAFNLCEIEGYTPMEAAKLLGVSSGTVRSNLHRAKMHLRQTLAPYFPQYVKNS